VYAGLCAACAGIATGLVNPVDNSPVKFDIIGFDACLMAMYEVAAALQPFARYLLASQLLEPGHGWDYKSLGDLTIASTNTSGSGAPTAIDVGRFFIDGYFNEAREEASSGLTLALVDLTNFPQLINAVTDAANQLTTLLRNNASEWWGGACNDKQMICKRKTARTDSIYTEQRAQAAAGTGWDMVCRLHGLCRCGRQHLLPQPHCRMVISCATAFVRLRQHSSACNWWWRQAHMHGVLLSVSASEEKEVQTLAAATAACKGIHSNGATTPSSPTHPVTRLLCLLAPPSPGQAIRILQQRALLDQIAGAEDNCDLGSTLNRLRSIMAAGRNRNALSSAFTNYTSLIKAFRRDGELSDVSGGGGVWCVRAGGFALQQGCLSATGIVPQCRSAGCLRPGAGWGKCLKQGLHPPADLLEKQGGQTGACMAPADAVLLPGSFLKYAQHRRNRHMLPLPCRRHG
jgi:hypothetical protein